jgi:hypothetical protein
MIEPSGQTPDVANNVVRRLKIFEGARREIVDASTVEQVNRILALATGLAAAARKATDREMEAEAEALKLEAKRRLGQLMEAQKETVGLNRGGRPKTGVSETPVSEKPVTLAEAGIDKNLAKQARAAARLPEAEFKKAVEAKRESVRTRSNKTRIKAAVEKCVPASTQMRITHLDIIAIWDKASPEARSKAISSIGLRPLLAALPPDWIPLLEKWLADRRQLTAPAVVATNSDVTIPISLRRARPRHERASPPAE